MISSLKQSKIIRLVLCFSFLYIASCTYRASPNIAVCEASCVTKLQHCTKVCRNNCGRCTKAATQSTARHYAHYEQGQMVKGKIIALQLNSFRDPLQCRKVTCNCRADYQICMQSCGGVVQKSLQHAPLCS